MTIHYLALRRAGMVPSLIIAGFPAPMRDDRHLDAGRTHGLIKPPQIIDKPDLVGHRF